MKQITFLKSFFLLCALIVGSNSVWAQTTIYSWNGNGSTTTANETGGTATAQGGNSNIAVGVSQKGNYCLKLNKGFSNTYYILITLDEELNGGETITIGAFRTSSTAAVLGVDFGTTATQSLKDDTDYFSTGTGIPTDWEFEVPAEAAGSNTIRLYRNSGSTGMWVSKVVITGASTDPSSNAAFANETPEISYPATKTYTQEATTETGYTGSVTYTMTANTAGATIDAESGLVTVTKGGSVTVKATAPAVTGWAKSEATYTLTVTDTRTANGLEFAEATQNINIGEVLSAPTLTNPHNLSVTYSSSDEAVATVNASTGDVTGVSGGNATITATFAGDDEYLPGNASYTVNVQKVRPANAILYETFDTNDETGGNDGTWSNISSTPTPTFDNEGWTYDGYAASECVRTKKSGYFTTPALGFTGNATLTFKMASWGNDTNNGYVDIVGDGTFDDETTQKLVSIKKSEWDTFTLELIGITPTTKIKFSDNGNSKRLFLDEVTIVATAVPATITAAEYATFSSAYATDFSTTGITVYTAEDKETSVALNEVDGGQVPANTPVVLYKAGADGTAINVPVIASATAISSTNDLHVVGEGGLTGVDNIFVLSKKNNKVGFRLWDKTQTLNAGKIYLQGQDSYGARDFLAFDGTTTGIANVEANDNLDANAPMYNLAGQRVTKSYKGVVIVNGKKMLNK